MDQPDTWAKAVVKNDWGSTIYNVQLNHRYDNDHYDVREWDLLESGTTSSIYLKVRYWTGFGRTGRDFWLIRFEADGMVWTCKDSFDCVLTINDSGGTVTCRVYKDGGNAKMDVICPGSSDCTVSLSAMPNNISEYARPVYVIGHRCNDVEDIGLAISRGCNGIECDLQYDDDEDILYVNHDNKAGYTFDEWLVGARRIADIYPLQFSLIIFDCKFAADHDIDLAGRIGAMNQAFNKARQALRTYNGTTLQFLDIVFSVADYEDREVLSGIMNVLKGGEHISIDQSKAPGDVQTFFMKNNIKSGFYGNGITSILPDWDLRRSISDGVKKRDEDGIITKVYVWTLAQESSIRRYLKEKVDGVMVNVPGTIAGNSDLTNGLYEALKVVYELPEIRLANRNDVTHMVQLRTWLVDYTAEPIQYGIPLKDSQLHNKANAWVGSKMVRVEGKSSCYWNGKLISAGAILPVGDHTLEFEFVPNELNYFTIAKRSMRLQLAKALPEIVWKAPDAIVYGDLLSNHLLSASVSAMIGGKRVELKGSFLYFLGEKPIKEGEQLPPGEQTLSVRFEPEQSDKFMEATVSVKLQVLKAQPEIVWNAPEAIVFGDMLGSNQLNASAVAMIGGKRVVLKGKFQYFIGDEPIQAGEKLRAGVHALKVMFESDQSDYFKIATGSVQLRVWLATHVFKKYKVGNEETFSHLALKHYGHATPYYWQWIIDHNKGIIPENYRHTREGTKVYIPEPPPSPVEKK